MKPMLATPASSVIPYPMLLSPKLDGIRCLIIDGVACGRSLKPIPNKHVQELFGRPELNGLDGELIVGPSTADNVFQTTSSGVMSIDGKPEVSYFVFDNYTDAEAPFNIRLKNAVAQIRKQKHCVAVPHDMIYNGEQLLEWEQKYLALGYEGVMLRLPHGPYKFGRSTAKEAWLLKVKRFQDSEAKIIGYVECKQNTNAAERNRLGQLERSSCKSGMVGKGVLGSITVKDLKTGVIFDIGTGFTADQRAALWGDGDSLIGRVVKYKSQPVGVKDKPRFPVFLGFRSVIDL